MAFHVDVELLICCILKIHFGIGLVQAKSADIEVVAAVAHINFAQGGA